MSKVDKPESVYRSIASTASSLSILPQPPLVCHIPLRTLHISNESFPLLSLIRSFSIVVFVLELESLHRINLALWRILRELESILVVVDELMRVKVENRLWLDIAAIFLGVMEEEDNERGELKLKMTKCCFLSL
jgi:hypothetical protein